MYVRVDKAELRRACEALKVTEPLVTISEDDHGKTHGEYHHNGHIYIYCGTERPTGSLLYLTRDLNRTFLHELRHHWQNTYQREMFDDKPGAYWTTKCEEDARAWADENVTNYRVIRLAPRRARSRLSKLSAAESRVR